VSVAREEVLARVRAALVDVPRDERPDDVVVTREYERASGLDQATVLEMFIDHVADYGAQVRHIPQAQLPDEIAAACLEHGVGSLVVPTGFPAQWVSAARVPILRDDPPMRTTSLDAAGGVITTAAVGIAETGTVVLVAGPGMGRRALSLVPDVHVCVVRTDQVVASVPEAMQRLQPFRDQPITFISGGSATSDIELVRVEGVHGPRTLVVLLVDPDPGDGVGAA
jgi:L-lactate dehydrogenase complex protein LldG